MKQITFVVLSWLLLASIAHADVIASSGAIAASSVSEESTSDDEDDIQVLYVQKTRYGDVKLVGQDAMPADTIIFNGRKVFEDQGMHVGIFGYYQTNDSDVILLESNPGGSATPASHMSFLVINREGSSQVLSDPAFIAAYDNAIQVTTDKDKRIYVRLGFPIEYSPGRGKTEPVAILDSGKLIMKSLSRIHGDYQPGPTRSISQYFAEDKWIALRKSFYNSDKSQRVELFCDDLNLESPKDTNENKHDLCAAALFANQSNQWFFQEQFEMPYGGWVKEFNGHKLIVETLEYGDNDDFGNPTKHTKLVFNIENGKLIEDLAAEGKPRLVHALETDADVIQIGDIIHSGVDVNAADGNGQVALVVAVKKGRADIVKALLDHGANVNTISENGDPVLIIAVTYGRTDIVQMLLDKGANPNATQSDGTPALVFAGTSEMAKVLLDKGANPNLKNADGLTALDFAIRSGSADQVRLLKDRGAKASEH